MPCPKCGAQDRQRAHRLLSDPGVPSRRESWVKRAPRNGLTLSTLGRMIHLDRVDASPLALRLAELVPPPPDPPGERVALQFFAYGSGALLVGGIAAYLLFPHIVELGGSYLLHFVIGFLVALTPLLLVALALRPSERRHATYLVELARWDEKVREAENLWVCSDCGEVSPD
jgi:predicted RNA-binding Zn-ribbon protein involved in translation (DUF1610 family)